MTYVKWAKLPIYLQDQIAAHLEELGKTPPDRPDGTGIDWARVSIRLQWTHVHVFVDNQPAGEFFIQGV